MADLLHERLPGLSPAACRNYFHLRPRAPPELAAALVGYGFQAAEQAADAGLTAAP